MIQYRALSETELERKLFLYFVRRQAVDKCLRLENGVWTVKSDPFIDDWSENDYEVLISCLKNTVLTGGLVLGAFSDGKLKGFASVESEFFGRGSRYLDLSSIHVSEDMRRNGIGKALFLKVAEWAKEKGAEKLYISSHSAVETQAFYRSLSCRDAEEYNMKHVSEEPFDCQLEYNL